MKGLFGVKKVIETKTVKVDNKTYKEKEVILCAADTGPKNLLSFGRS